MPIIHDRTDRKDRLRRDILLEGSITVCPCYLRRLAALAMGSHRGGIQTVHFPSSNPHNVQVPHLVREPSVSPCHVTRRILSLILQLLRNLRDARNVPAWQGDKEGRHGKRLRHQPQSPRVSRFKSKGGIRSERKCGQSAGVPMSSGFPHSQQPPHPWKSPQS